MRRNRKRSIAAAARVPTRRSLSSPQKEKTGPVQWKIHICYGGRIMTPRFPPFFWVTWAKPCGCTAVAHGSRDALAGGSAEGRSTSARRRPNRLISSPVSRLPQLPRRPGYRTPCTARRSTSARRPPTGLRELPRPRQGARRERRPDLIQKLHARWRRRRRARPARRATTARRTRCGTAASTISGTSRCTTCHSVHAPKGPTAAQGAEPDGAVRHVSPQRHQQAAPLQPHAGAEGRA